jgi:hypothetical protein
MTGNGRGTLPNLLIIGAGKAGTTSLHRYLSFHPEIHMSTHKELCFFDDRKRWGLGVEWYKANFDASFPVNGESSPRYARFPMTPGVPERIRQVLGTPKLIYMVRDPVDRLLSQYTQMLDDWPTTPPFDAVLPDIENATVGYVPVSSYFFQLSQYLKLFPRESIHVVVNERLNAKPRETLREVFRFIGVDENFWSPEFDQRENVGERKKTMAPWFKRWAPAFAKQLTTPTNDNTPWRLRRAAYWLSRLGGQVISKPRLSQSDDFRLQTILKSDVKALRDFLADPLPEWRPYA